MTNGFSEHASPDWPVPESPSDRAARIRHEAALIAAAEAEIDAGLGISEEDLETWLTALKVDPDTPLPATKIPAHR